MTKSLYRSGVAHSEERNLVYNSLDTVVLYIFSCHLREWWMRSTEGGGGVIRWIVTVDSVIVDFQVRAGGSAWAAAVS